MMMMMMMMIMMMMNGYIEADEQFELSQLTGWRLEQAEKERD